MGLFRNKLENQIPIIMRKSPLIYLLLAILTGFTSCKKDKDDDTTEPSVITGWDGDDDPGTVPSAVNFGNGQNVPAAYDIVPKFPPIGDQGQYGTCVAWASGYNMKSALEGMDRGLNTNQLASSSNQISPRDLFTAIPDASKGQNCNGTNFTDALDLLLNRGAATLQTVPYNNMNGCSNANLQSSWTQEAANHRIKSYRKISLNVAAIKENIANNVPVVCGAKLSDAFMTWNNDNVMTANTTYNQTGIHAYHALVIAGYDDSKGPNGAFRIINSWSPQWGDAGYIWVDYNFFVNEFCFGGNVYIGINDKGNNPPPNTDSTSAGNVDLAAWAFSDISLGYDPNVQLYGREIVYNVYNIGDQAALASDNWDIYYIYYNAFDAYDYGVMFYDEFNTSVPAGTYQWVNDHYVLNYDIQGGDNFANAVFQQTSLYQDYYVPDITGLYYLVMVADGHDVYAEPDEQNNVFYTTPQLPVYFVNGYAPRHSSAASQSVSLHNYNFKNNLTPDPVTLKNSPYRSAVTRENPNAYTVDEIRQLIRKQRNTPFWNQKLQECKNRMKYAKHK